MKRFKEWFRMYEMALGNTFQGSGRFSGVDNKLMGRMFPKIKEKLKSFLQHLDFVDIHMYFGTPPVGDWSDTDVVKVDKLRNYFFNGGEGEDGSVLDVRVPSSDIVFVKQGSFADALTPWMILHTFAHAVIDVVLEGTSNHRDFANVKRPKLQAAVLSALKKINELGLNRSGLYIFFPMGSLRKSIAQESGGKVQKGFQLIDNELYREMFVYYLTKGGKIPIPGDYKEKLMSIAGRSDMDAEKTVSKIQEISNEFKNILESCRGDVLTDGR